MKKLMTILLFMIIPLYAANCAIDTSTPNTENTLTDDAIPTEQLLTSTADATECATQAFADTLAQKLTDVPEDTQESDIEKLIYAVFSDGDTLRRVVACPEIESTDETDSIKFLPIKYTFPGGREIVVNYETQPKIIKQRLMLANRATLPGGPTSPRLGDPDDDTIWTNTDPAWYGIIVTQAGALRQFVGDGNNNTISLRYIEDNIDSLMPQSSQCTSGSALADDDENINLAANRTAQGDQQDFYVAGNKDLRWISYTEIGLDVVITVATFGGGAVISGVTKSARAARVIKNLKTGIQALEKTESVAKYIKKTLQYEKLVAKSKNLKRTRITNLDKDLERAMEQLAKMKPGSKKHIAQQAHVDELTQRVRALDDLALDPNNAAAREIIEKSGSKTARQSMRDVLNDGALGLNPDEAKDMEKLAAEIKELENSDKVVQQYKKAAESLKDLEKYRNALRLTKLPAQRGNILARTLQRTKDTGRYIKKANTGGKKITQANKVAQETINTANKTLKAEAKAKQAAQAASTASKVSKITKAINGLKTVFGGGQKVEYARTSMQGGRIRDWLFHSSLKNAGKLGRMEESASVIYGALKFVGKNMYDYTETSTGEYTSGIQFKPLLLLSADDLKETGQDNVVNHGMWLLWQGDTYSATDDDAAYLQAMDFAEKFYRDLLDVQSETNDHSCDVDIYVVRPIIRNPGSDDAELYYLIMNDMPWTTNEE